MSILLGEGVQSFLLSNIYTSRWIWSLLQVQVKYEKLKYKDILLVAFHEDESYVQIGKCVGTSMA